MSTTRELNDEMIRLREENVRLKSELDALNENTIILSMNDMKCVNDDLRRQNELLEETLCNSVSDYRYKILMKRKLELEGILTSVTYFLYAIIKDIQKDDALQGTSRTMYKIKLQQILSVLKMYIDPELDDNI